MQCPTCEKVFHPQPEGLKAFWEADYKSVSCFKTQQCPSCHEVILIKERGVGSEIGGNVYINRVDSEEIIYPLKDVFSVPDEVPEDYKKDLLEACEALQYSPKASAALSRRLLQKTLREKIGIKKKDLSVEIDSFIESGSAPTYLTGAVDAVRQIGNFAAHPIKNTNTGEIVEVEAGEAEWLLEVLESLFDFVFVQPKKLQQRRESLNAKLRELGKPELKGA